MPKTNFSSSDHVFSRLVNHEPMLLALDPIFAKIKKMTNFEVLEESLWDNLEKLSRYSYTAHREDLNIFSKLQKPIEDNYLRLDSRNRLLFLGIVVDFVEKLLQFEYRKNFDLILKKTPKNEMLDPRAFGECLAVFSEILEQIGKNKIFEKELSSIVNHSINDIPLDCLQLLSTYSKIKDFSGPRWDDSAFNSSEITTLENVICWYNGSKNDLGDLEPELLKSILDFKLFR